ncbi:MAG: adenosylcobinamide-GDP ribazoletransferase [Pseudomonadota bacterium]
MKNEAAALLLAVQFLTRIPIPSRDLYSATRMVASVRYYPLVGLFIGCISAAAFLVSGLLVPHPIAVLLAIAVGLLVTGGFHEDGLADTFDGIGGGIDRARALEIMKDSRLGTYGTLALIVCIALKASSLILLPVSIVAAALIMGHGMSRLSSLLVIATSRYVRGEGTGKPVAESASALTIITATVTCAVIVILWCHFLPPMAMACAIVGLVLGHGFMRLFFEPKLGGYTGDTLGAVQQMSELGFYLGLLAWL